MQIALAAVLLACANQSTPPATPAPVARPPAVADVFRAGETGHWSIAQGGERLGWHASEYAGRVEADGGRPAGHAFRGWLVLDVPPAALRSDVELLVDDHGAPLRLVQRVEIGDARTRIEVAFEGGRSVVDYAQGGSTRRMASALPDGARVLANNFVSHLELAFRLAPEGDALEVPLFATAQLAAFAYAAERAAPLPDDPPARRTWRDTLGQTLVFGEGGRLERVEAPLASIVVERVDEPFERFTLEAPRAPLMGGDFHVEEVRLVHEGVELAGFLTKPKGATGRLPAVQFFSGSGAQDRHGYAGGVDIGTHEVLDAVTSAGFAVLRMDDRGAGSSSPPSSGAGLDDALADARRAADWLLSRDDVDPARLFLVGHSEGGIVAVLLAERLEPVGGLVLMASPGRPLHELMLEQNRAALAESGLEGAALEARMDALESDFARIVSPEPLDAATLGAEFQPLLATRRWLQDHAAVDLPRRLAALRVPVLVLQGELDIQVSPERDARALDAALRAAGHPDHALHLFERLDHLFKPVPGERSSIADYLTDRRVDAGFLETLTGWLREHASRGAQVPR